MIAAQEKPNYGYSFPVGEAPAAARGPEPRGRVRSERRARVVLTALILSVFALGIVYVLFNAFTTNIGYRLENLKRQVTELDAENQTLEMLVGKLDTLTRVETLAVTDLGMVAPTEEDTLVIAIADPSALQMPVSRVSPAGTAAADDDRAPPEAETGAPSDPGLLEVLLGFICRHEAGAEPARAG